MNIRGVTLIEAILGFTGLGILLLMVYVLFLGGMQNWTTMTPQINARSVAREILYGKTGEEWGGLVGEIRDCETITIQSPEGDITGSTILNFQTHYATGTLVGTFAICYEWSGNPSAYNLDNSVSNIGTLTKTIWQLVGTSTWNVTSTKILANNIRLGSSTYTTFNNYPLFKYYTGLGIEKYGNELIPSISTIRQMSISMIFDIDNDKDGKFGEDPPGGGNQDNDRKVDEDKPNDFAIKTKVAFMNL